MSTNKKTLEKNIGASIFRLSPQAKVNISVWKLFKQPFSFLWQNGKTFLLTAVPVALLLTVCSFVFKRNILCNINTDFSLSSNLCSETTFSFYGDLVVRFLLLSLFAIKWHHFALAKTPLTLKNIFCVTKADFKSIGIMLLFFVINFLPLIALFILMIRQPNPNWKIELLYFTAIAWVFLLPLLAIRFYSIIAFFLEGKKPYPSIKQIWINTSGNMLKLILSAAMLVFLTLFIFMQYFGAMQSMPTSPLSNVIASEIEYNILVTIFISCFINYCETQKELLFEGETND